VSHPQCCKDPDNCSLTYIEHLRGFALSATAIPTRTVNRTPGNPELGIRAQPDEPLVDALVREKRWDRDTAAFRRLWKDGVKPRRMEGSALRERMGDTKYDIENRPVTIDYSDPT
jgi:hypothetical protein